MSLWDSILQLVGSVVSPDWGALVLLLPLAVFALVAAYLLWVIRRLATAGPTTSRPLPVAPTPAGIHMPGPSLAPFLAAGGALAFFLATLFIRIEPAVDPASGKPVPDSTTLVIGPLGTLALAIGLVAFVGALLYWGREANRDYDALEPPPVLPAIGHGPPPGVHVPGPSFRPLLASVATAAMLLGLVLHPAVLVAGVVMMVVGLLGWLNDARKEYREVVRADQTGHLENIPAPRFPTGTLIVFAALFVGSLLVAGGIVPPRDSGGGTAPSAGPATPAPASPGPSTPAPSGTAASPGATPGGSPGQSVTLKVTAAGIAFDTASLEAPANTPFKIELVNNDAGVPHNVAIHEGSPTGRELWRGELFAGVDTRTYEVPALPAGTYGFICTAHPNVMTGTLTVR
jgi:plastocyanin